MKLFRLIFFVLLMSSLMLGQSSSPGSSSPSNTTAQIADQLKSLQDAMALQQRQIQLLQQQLAEQKERDEQARVLNATYTTPAPAPGSALASDTQEIPKESPLSFRIGGADFTPGGFLDFENVFRSTNTGNVASTQYGAIPFSNAANGAGHLTEYRSTGQYSRMNLKITSKFGENDITGYIESDFNGNDAGNVFVTTNPHTLRLRLYWLDLKRGNWEFLGGQSWGLLTPNRVGVSPFPSDLALSIGEDANVHVGINHSRAGTFRAVYHPNNNLALAFGVENPQQFVSNEVVFPNLFNSGLSTQFDNNTNTPGSPNVAPDFNAKLAWDSDPGGKHLHLEVGGTSDSVKISVRPSGAANFVTHSKFGGGVAGALNYEITKRIRFLTNGFYGNGIGKYLIGLAPQAVVFPTTQAGGVPCTSTGSGTGIAVTGNCDADVSLVHSYDGTVGFELLPFPKSQFGLYYGGVYAQKNFFRDLTGGTAQPFIGFGAPGSANTNNRSIQQATIDFTQTFWKSPQYGALLLVTQASYITRAPYFVAAGAPRNAHLTDGFLSLRYVLP
jgi:hypothetical protein